MTTAYTTLAQHHAIKNQHNVHQYPTQSQELLDHVSCKLTDMTACDDTYVPQ